MRRPRTLPSLSPFRLSARRWLALAATALFAACGGGGDSGPTGNTTGSISIDGSGGTALTLLRGSTQSSTITVIRTNYTGPVTLAVQGLPTGVTIDFSPSTIPSGSNTSTITATVSPTATPGTYTATASASGTGIATATLPFTITIPQPTITVTAGTGTYATTQGQSVNVPVSITRGNGYTDAVTLTTGQLPTGVTAAFAPATLGTGVTASTLTLTAAANATPGSYQVVVTASGTGVTSQTSTVNLTIGASTTPSVSVSAAPAALSVQAGQNGTSTITIARSGGFTGDVALAVSGAPTGTTAAVSPTSLSVPNTGSTLTLTVGANTTPGLYNLTITASGTGVANATTTVALTVTAAPSITISAAPNTVSLAQGANATSTITLTRTNYAGDVALAASNLPTGVTAVFAPATLSGSTLTSTMTLTATAGATLGTQNATVTASGTGVSNATTSIGTTVTAAQGFSLAATAVSAVQGTNGTSTITITRTGGYAGAVTLSTGTLPNGVNASFAPNGTTGNTSTLTLTVDAGATPGTSAITVTGSGAGLTGNVSTTFNLTVTASGGGGGNLTWTFCDANRYPSWFAVQNGAGAWTAVVGANVSGQRTYQFSVTTNGAIAYAIPRSGGGTDVTVQYGTAAELSNSGTQECVNNKPTRTVSGTVAGIGISGGNIASATIYASGASGSANANGPFSISGAPTGNYDLLGLRTLINGMTFTSSIDRFILRRDQSGSSIATPLDFGAAEALAPATAQVTVNNLGSDNLNAFTMFYTSRGAAGTFFNLAATQTSPVTVLGVPNAQLQAGDLHALYVAANAGTTQAQNLRFVFQYNQQLANRTITLGPSMSVPTITSTTTPYRRLTASGPWITEYPDAVAVSYQDAATNGNTWTLSVSRTFAGAGASTWSLAMPDFVGVGSFNPAWAISSNATFSTTISGVSGFTNNAWAEGGQLRAASRTGQVP